jgi:hypothetical protein
MTFTRRDFTRTFSTLLLAPAAWAAGREIQADVVIIGGSTGGVAAALAALRMGRRVVMTEETAWIGGQLTSQGVPPDEHPWIEGFGATRAYRAYRDAVRQYYFDHYPLTAAARANRHLNPGGGSVSRISHEPRVSLAVLEAMLAPYVTAGRLAVLTNQRPVAADVEGDRVRAVTVESTRSGQRRTLSGPYFLDATECGDLLPLTRTEYVTGFESRKETGETQAPEQAQPENHQSFTVCFAMGHEKGADHTIEKPKNYEFWRDYVPQLTPKWPGKLLDWSYSSPATLEPRRLGFDPEADGSVGGVLNLWIYRRIVRAENYEPGFARSGATLVNWPQNDYWLGNLYGGTPEENARHLEGGRELSRSLLYWMQTEAPRADGGAGWPGLHLCPEMMGTEDGLAMYPYIRESRRIRAELTVTAEHVGTEERMKATGLSREEVTARRFDDTVGVGSYRIDLHPSSGGDNYIDVSSLPFQIPLGALIPRRVENLLAACKNLGVTHITNGCYRLHPVEWNIGESAGALAAHCVEEKVTPRQVRNDEKRLRAFQGALTAQGVELDWPRIRPR